MSLRHVVPRECRHAFFNYGPRARFPRRTYATQVQATDTSPSTQLDTAILEASSESASPDGSAAPTGGRRRRRRVQPRLDPAVENYLTFKHMQQTSGKYGTETSNYYAPHTLLSNPPRPADVTLELLLASQAHLGHSTSLWNPANSRYIFGIREGIHIISLDITAAHLRRASRVVSGVAERGGIILFAGTRTGFDRCVVRAAQLSGGCHLFERWTPGSITNGQQILGKCRMKVINEKDQLVSGFDNQLYEWPALKPDLVVCLNPLENRVLLQECAQMGIPTIGIIDTDANPSWVTYPIPANDDSIRSVQVIAGVLGRAGQEGQQKRVEAANRGEITYNPADKLTLPVDWEESRASHEAEMAALKGGSTNPAFIQSEENTSNHASSTNDDAAFFAKNPDEELRNIFNKLTDVEKQAVFAGTFAPEKMSTLRDRLTEEQVMTLAQTVYHDDIDVDSEETITQSAAERDAQVTQRLEELLAPLSEVDREGIAEALDDHQLLANRLAGLEGLLSDDQINELTQLLTGVAEEEHLEGEEEDDEVSARLRQIVDKLNDTDRDGLTEALDNHFLLSERLEALESRLPQEEWVELVGLLPGVALDGEGNVIVEGNNGEDGNARQSNLHAILDQLSDEDRNGLVEALKDPDMLADRLAALEGKIPEEDLLELGDLFTRAADSDDTGSADADHQAGAELDEPSLRRKSNVGEQMGTDGDNAPRR